MVEISEADLEQQLRQGSGRLQAYYYGFDPTGVEAVDRILAAVATAGKAYHNTEQWGDPWDDDETPPADLIQAAANLAAAEFKRRVAS